MTRARARLLIAALAVGWPLLGWLGGPEPVEVDRRLLLALAGLLAFYVAVVLPAALRARPAQSAPRPRDRAGAGALGLAVTALAPRGVVSVDCEEWSAVAEGGAVAPGQPVVVVARLGAHLRVRRLSSHAPIGWAVSAKSGRSDRVASP